MRNSTKWSKGEITHLRRLYGWHGYAVIARGLRENHGQTRSTRAIGIKASALGLTGSLPDDWVPIVDANPQRHGPGFGGNKAMLQAARRAGVARQRFGMQGRPWVARREWVDDYMAGRFGSEWDAVEREVCKREWLTSSEVGALMGISSKRATAWLNNTRGWWSQQSIRKKRMLGEVGQPWYYHPQDVKQVVTLWRNRENVQGLQQAA
jgi:hypothetical protein